MLSEVDVARERFEVLFREHVAGIASYCRWCLRARGDAEDAVAEVFLVAWRRLDDVPVGEASRAWLYATARRVVANQVRAGARRSSLYEKLNGQPVAIEQGDEQPLAGQVHEALAALAPRDRELLFLAECEGFTATDLGTIMRRSPVTVRVRLHRAKRRFRAAFEARTPATDTTVPRPDSPRPTGWSHGPEAH
jgi:RNA polymerase sigma-70 factor (ECF subfamily)